MPMTAPDAVFENVQDQCVPVLAVRLAVSGLDCVAVTTGVSGVADAPPGTPRAAAMTAEAAQARSLDRRTLAPGPLAIAAMPIDLFSNCVGPYGTTTRAPTRNSRGWPRSVLLQGAPARGRATLRVV